MRLSRIRARGFRGFATQVDVSLDADVVILSGPNGQGKTSLLDAVLWGLSGAISRFEGTGEQVVSLYSPTGEAEVEVELASGDDLWTVRRAWDGEIERLHLAGPSETLSGPSAAIGLSKLLGHSEPSDSGALTVPSIHTVLTRGVYLQQDLVREFLDADDATLRYENLSQLFGTRRVVDLQVDLERQKASWSKSLNSDKKLAQDVADQLRQLEAEIETLQAGEGEVPDSAAWSNWWQTVTEVAEHTVDGVEISSSEAPVKLDRALRSLESERRGLERQLSVVDQLISDAADLVEESRGLPSVQESETEVESKREECAALERQLKDAEQALAESRRQAARQHDEERDHALLATLALRHLGEICPVCQQEYDREVVEERLTRIAAAEDDTLELPSTELVDELRGKLQAGQDELAKALGQLESAFDRVRKVEALRSRVVGAGLKEVGALEPAEWHARLLERRASIAESIAMRRRLEEEGESLSLGIARAGESARLDALRQEERETARRQAELQRDLDDREETGRVAQEMIEGLRTASQAIVSRELQRIRPTAQRIYSSIDPHPALRRIDIAATMFRGRGHVNASVLDPETEAVSEHPERVLSSSQINALALSLFLALNVCARDLPFEALILDDPLQSLDDINLLGLVDLLRRLAGERQLVISTHDTRFSSLLERKFRPVRPGRRTLSIEINSWTREGPSIRVREVEQPHDLFIVA